tara:strand:+ start:30721 stop:31020 length:300 start_codon:yes stop_codon:yes gene_type:complete
MSGILKKFENYNSEIPVDGEVVLVMMNDQPIGIVKENKNIKWAVVECINDTGYDEVTWGSHGIGDKLDIVDQMGDTLGNPCRVDGARINIHLIRLRMYE